MSFSSTVTTRPRASTIQFAEVEDDDASVDRGTQSPLVSAGSPLLSPGSPLLPAGSPLLPAGFPSSEMSSSSSEASGSSETEDSNQLDEETNMARRVSSKGFGSEATVKKAASTKHMSTMRVLAILKSFNFFSNYESKVLSKLASLVTQATHPAGTVVFRQNDPPGNCYAVVSGQVGVFVNIPIGQNADEDDTSANAEERKQRRASFAPARVTITRRSTHALDVEMAAILAVSKPTVEGFSMYHPDLDLGTKVATLQAGSLVGELALLNDQKRTASLKCLQNTSMIIIHRKEFDNVLGEEMRRGQQEKDTFLLAHLPGLRHLPAIPKGRVRPHPSYYFQKITVATGHEFLKQGQVADPSLNIVFHGTVERRRSEANTKFMDPLAQATRLATMEPSRASAEASDLAARKASRASRPKSAALRGLPQRPQSATSLGRSGAKQLFGEESSHSKVARRVGTLQVGGVFGSLPVLGPEPFTVVATSRVEVFSIGTDLAELPRKLIESIQAHLSHSVHLQLEQLRSSRFAAEAPGLFQKPKPPGLGLGFLHWQVTPVLPAKCEKDEDQLANRPQTPTRKSPQAVRKAATTGKRPTSAPNK